MRIAIFTNNYLPNPYGVSGSVESFRKEFEKNGHEVFVFAPEWKGYQDKNPKVFRFPAFETNIKIRFPIAVPYSRKISKVLENLNIDIIHSQHPNLLGGAAMRFARKYNIPLVFTWHTLYDQYTHFVPFLPRRFSAWLAIRNAMSYANKCSAVVVPTLSVGEIIKSWGVTNENITAIPTGVEEDQFANPNREGVREKYDVKKDEILLFVMTRLTAEKNMDFLVEAAMEILKNNKNTKLMICGDGNLKSILEKKVTDAALQAKVIFVGIVSEDEKKNYYAAGDIFVYASKSETQGMVLTEAMYSGLPIVAVRATGVKDIVEDGRTGYLVDENIEEFGKAVQKLIDDTDIHMRFGEEAKKLAIEKYTSSVCARKMLEVYERAIERNNICHCERSEAIS
jgi:1,2-diacylglycerol 3-alpha-glucosyltransferase